MIGITQLRDNTRDLIDRVEVADLLVLRRNQPVAVIIHPDRLAQLIDRIEDLEDALAVHGVDPNEVKWGAPSA